MICLTVYLRSWDVDIHSVCAVSENWDLVETYNVQHVEPNTIYQYMVKLKVSTPTLVKSMLDIDIIHTKVVIKTSCLINKLPCK